MKMNKIFSLGMGIIVASQVVSAPGAYAVVADLQKAASIAQTAARASADKAYTLSGSTYDNNSEASETPAAASASGSQSKQPGQNLESVSPKFTAERRVRVPHLTSKTNKSVGEGVAAGGGVGFVGGFLAGFTVCMIPAAIVSQVPIVGKALGVIVGIPSVFIGAVVGLFTGALGALGGAAIGGVVGGVND